MRLRVYYYLYIYIYTIHISTVLYSGCVLRKSIYIYNSPSLAANQHIGESRFKYEAERQMYNRSVFRRGLEMKCIASTRAVSRGQL